LERRAKERAGVLAAYGERMLAVLRQCAESVGDQRCREQLSQLITEIDVHLKEAARHP
jgi:hypothetical protein